jgi:hypothetical protein
MSLRCSVLFLTLSACTYNSTSSKVLVINRILTDDPETFIASALLLALSKSIKLILFGLTFTYVTDFTDLQ